MCKSNVVFEKRCCLKFGAICAQKRTRDHQKHRDTKALHQDATACGDRGAVQRAPGKPAGLGRPAECRPRQARQRQRRSAVHGDAAPCKTCRSHPTLSNKSRPRKATHAHNSWPARLATITHTKRSQLLAAMVTAMVFEAGLMLARFSTPTLNHRSATQGVLRQETPRA